VGRRDGGRDRAAGPARVHHPERQSVTISIFGGSLHLPLGVALLLAAICGVLLVAVPGYGRIFQLRRAVRRAGNTEQVR